MKKRLNKECNTIKMELDIIWPNWGEKKPIEVIINEVTK